MNNSPNAADVAVHWGIDPVWAVFHLVAFSLAVFATVRCCTRGRRGISLIPWLLLIWLVPVAGALVALYAHGRSSQNG